MDCERHCAGVAARAVEANKLRIDHFILINRCKQDGEEGEITATKRVYIIAHMRIDAT